MTADTTTDLTAPELRDASCHRLLLALAGRLPDRELRHARGLLADGETAGAAALVLDGLAEHGTAVTREELGAALRLAPGPDEREPESESDERGPDAGADAAERFLLVAEPPDLACVFAATGPGAVRGPDAVDDALVLAVEASAGGVAGVWRCWRLPVFADERERRVYVVQTDDPASAPALAGALYDALEAVGEEQAGVEVVGLDQEVSGYQRQALDAALLLWASGATGEPPFQLARVYDLVDPVLGPGFTVDHPVLDDAEERARVLDYLASGVPVLSTTARTPDPLDREAGDAVPSSFLTDGEWIWTEAVGYFLERHGLAPDPGLLAHIRYADYAVPELDQETASRAAEYLLRPQPDAAPVWTAPGR
ncbi:hypothetical protein GXW83_21780 [Streptacidiphilus sp. PB12-B1b]|uniref:hypothetical protein n=1 Tax=Streptacidiphilus sp. PB12-B1b TaxID=2705012 RepID=UPI0015FCA9F4|nr:hypothetical protein [Streptacidiphilus sp. PB12-B1b]QMU77932.1 hypothetical protein GXW83_21780 [Streptacidiphilus sp. PB12-B1b]